MSTSIPRLAVFGGVRRPFYLFFTYYIFCPHPPQDTPGEILFPNGKCSAPPDAESNKKDARTKTSLHLIWRSIRDLNSGGAVNALSHFEFCAGKALVEQGRSKLVSLSPIFRRYQAVFDRQKPENGFSTNQTGIPRFGPVWQDFLEKCKISCKIIEG